MNKSIHTYIDLDVVNNNYSASASNPVLKFQETRNMPYLLGDASDYFASIVRFSLQTGNSLPVFIPVIKTGQSNPNRTIYNITLEVTYGVSTYNYTVPILYTPSDTSIQTPSAPLTTQDLSTEYYYYRNYRAFADDINQAFGECFELLTAVLNTGNQTMYNAFITTQCPFIDFDMDTSKFILTVDQLWANSINSTPGAAMYFSIYYNTALMNLLTGFRSSFVSSGGEKISLLWFTNSVVSNVENITPEATKFKAY